MSDPTRSSLAAENARLRAENLELARLRAELAQSRAENAELRPLAAEEEARLKLRQGFISALIVTAQNGYARDVDPFVGLCRETWGEEALFDALKDLPHGRKRLRTAEEAAAQGLPEFDPYGMGRTRLMYAAHMDDLARVEWLLKRGARLELAGSDGDTALAWASFKGRIRIVQLLLDKGALVSGASHPPLYAASLFGHLDVVRILLEHGADPNRPIPTGGGSTPLIGASANGFVEVARLLLDNGAIADLARASGSTPLYMAAHFGHKEVVELLLARGADVNGATSHGTPLHGACIEGHAAVISVLLAKGANVEAIQPSNGETPLRRAARRGHVEAVRALLRGGARVTGKSIAALAKGGHYPALGEVLPHALAADGALRGEIMAALLSLKTSTS